MIVEKDSSPVGKKYDLVGITGTWASYLPIPFWIIVYYLNLLEKLFPLYKGKDLVNPTFFAPIFICILAATIGQICIYIIYEKFEKGHYQSTGFGREPKLNDLLFEYRAKKSYGKLSVAVICWISGLICYAAFTTALFGLFIFFKYLRA